VHQEELKTLTFSYTSSEAVQRTYAPQGFFGLLLKDLEKDKYFLKIDLDDAFFRIFAVTMDAPFDFRKIGLSSVQLSLDYGAPDSPERKHGDFVFDAQHPEQKKFEVFMNSRRDTSYTVSTQYHFSPDTDWEGEKFSYEMPPETTQDRTLLINPYEHLGFLEVKVFPNRIDRGVIESTDVHLEYQDTKGWSRNRTLQVMPDSEAQFWRLRISDPTTRSYTYRFLHHLKDGTTRQTEPVTTMATGVAVDDPFDAALDILFIPAFAAIQYRAVFVDVEYHDDQNNYHREERLRAPVDSTEEVKLHLALLDPNKRLFRHRFTFVDLDGKIRSKPWVENSETLISIVE